MKIIGAVAVFAVVAFVSVGLGKWWSSKMEGTTSSGTVILPAPTYAEVKISGSEFVLSGDTIPTLNDLGRCGDPSAGIEYAPHKDEDNEAYEGVLRKIEGTNFEIIVKGGNLEKDLSGTSVVRVGKVRVDQNGTVSKGMNYLDLPYSISAVAGVLRPGQRVSFSRWQGGQWRFAVHCYSQ